MNIKDANYSNGAIKRNRDSIDEDRGLTLQKRLNTDESKEHHTDNERILKVKEMQNKARQQLQQLSTADPDIRKDKSGKSKLWGRKHFGGIIISDKTPKTFFGEDESETDPGGPVREMLEQDREYIAASRAIAKHTTGYRGAIFDRSDGVHFGVMDDNQNKSSTKAQMCDKNEKREKAERHLRAIFGENVDTSEFLGVETKSHLTELPVGVKIPQKRTLFVDKLKNETSSVQKNTISLSNDSLSELKKKKFEQLRAKRKQIK